jgi:hypothetical protein
VARNLARRNAAMAGGWAEVVPGGTLAEAFAEADERLLSVKTAARL